MGKFNDRERPFYFSTDKLLKLVELMKGYTKGTVSLIFVKRRMTAKVLYYVFKVCIYLY